MEQVKIPTQYDTPIVHPSNIHETSTVNWNYSLKNTPYYSPNTKSRGIKMTDEQVAKAYDSNRFNGGPAPLLNQSYSEPLHSVKVSVSVYHSDASGGHISTNQTPNP